MKVLKHFLLLDHMQRNVSCFKFHQGNKLGAEVARIVMPQSGEYAHGIAVFDEVEGQIIHCSIPYSPPLSASHSTPAALTYLETCSLHRLGRIGLQ